MDATIDKAMDIDDVPVVVDFRVHRDAMVWPMVAAGPRPTTTSSTRATSRPTSTETS